MSSKSSNARTLAALLAVLVLGLAACSSSNETASNNGDQIGDQNGGNSSPNSDPLFAVDLLGRCIAEQVAASLEITLVQLSADLSGPDAFLDQDVLRIANDICELRNLAAENQAAANPGQSTTQNTSQTDETAPPTPGLSPVADRDATLPASLIGAPDRFDPNSPPPGTNPDLDELWLACGNGDPLACNRLFYEADPETAYEAFGFSCGGRENLDCETLLGAAASTGASVSPASPPPGEDRTLDRWWSRCAAGSSSACAQLVLTAPGTSVYAYYGYSCGGRTAGDCTALLGDDGPPPALDERSPNDPAPGSDTYLDLLWQRCADLSATACGDLAAFSPPGSDYERFGLSCGWRKVTPCTRLFVQIERNS